MTYDDLTVNEKAACLDAVATGKWKLTCIPPCSYMTDEANAKNAWMAERLEAPFCDADGIRFWSGENPVAAIQKALMALSPINNQVNLGAPW